MKPITKILLILCILSMFLYLMGCTNEEKATILLKSQGYEDIQMTGYDWFVCSEDDQYHTGFSATKNGIKVHVVVCEGLFAKGATIRFR